MSEIIKLYENAGIQSLPTCNSCNRLDEYWSNGTYCNTCKDDKDNNECGMANYIYPPFTALKQLELICLLSKREMHINQKKNIYYIFTMTMGGSNVGKTIDEALAKYINLHWQDLTEEEKQQVKGILE